MRARAINLKVVMKSFILTTGLVFGCQVSASPEITGHSGKLNPGSTLTLKGNDFTSKKHGPPLFLWEADSGKSPRKEGRKSSWSGSLNGEMSTKIVAPNSSHSFRFDHGSSSGAALSAVTFDSDELYVYRRNYEDFDLSEDFAIRTRVENVRGTIKPGQVVRGEKSGASGVVNEVSNGSGRTTIYYKKSGGTINGSNSNDFEFGEPMSTDTAIFQNAEGSEKYPTGTYRTFNFKTFRMWNDQFKNNMYVGAGRDLRFNVYPEYTGAMLWSKRMSTPLIQKPFEWKTEEVYYRSSEIDRTDGLLDFRVNGKKYYSNTFKMRDSNKPDAYNKVYQSQVSNGAQKNSFIYYDMIYIDESWNHVLACNESQLSNCSQTAIQIPIEWSDESVKIQVNYGALNKNEDVYFYVFDENGNANDNGYFMCSNCPNSISASVK